MHSLPIHPPAESAASAEPARAALRRMQKDPFRAQALAALQIRSGERLAALIRRVALQLAVQRRAQQGATEMPAKDTMSRNKQRERDARACMALAEDLVMASLRHLHQPHWNPADDVSTPPDPLPVLALMMHAVVESQQEHTPMEP